MLIFKITKPTEQKISQAIIEIRRWGKEADDNWTFPLYNVRAYTSYQKLKTETKKLREAVDDLEAGIRHWEDG